MKRRAFIAGGAAAGAWPHGAPAQTSTKRPLIAVLSVVAQARNAGPLGAFLQGLRELDYVEGRDFDFAYRTTDGYLDRLPALAAEAATAATSFIA